VRTIAEVSSYAYSISAKGLWLNLYGSNKLATNLADGSAIKLSQETNYPWDGQISIKLDQAPARAFAIFVRIPGWCKGASVKVNGTSVAGAIKSGEYLSLNRNWKTGDKIAIDLPMPVKLLEANPLVEETRNQVAVKRGPVVYCLESVDNPTIKVKSIALSTKASLKPQVITIDNTPMMALAGEGKVIGETDWSNQLYREVSDKTPASAQIRLIPYFAWANRGRSEMEVWIPFVR
jgi:DUF1680 family protein